MARRRQLSKKEALIKDYLSIILGGILMAVSINLVYEPMALVTGGVSGLGIIVKKFTEGIMEGGLPIWVFNLLCNIPLLLISIKMRGFKFVVSLLLGTMSYIIGMMIIPMSPVALEDPLLASIFGGVISGVGIGLVFSASASTGGTDLLATLIHDKYRHLSVPTILTVIDTVIVAFGALVFGLSNSLYAVIAIYITAKVSDGILEGLKFAKMAYIISDHHVEIATAIMDSVDRGVTGISGMGMYSQKEKNLLLCVVSKKEIVTIMDISKNIDPNSFIIISDVREVMGEGFIEYRQ